jgi:hypothetical protein
VTLLSKGVVAGVAALALSVLGGGEAMACLPSIDTPEQLTERIRPYHAGYWNNASQVYLADVTEIAWTWQPSEESPDLSRSGMSLVDRGSTRLRLRPLLTLKGPEATEATDVSFGRSSLDGMQCGGPMWRDHTISPGLGVRYIVYVGINPATPPGEVVTVLAEDVRDQTTLSAWDAAARRARRRD